MFMNRGGHDLKTTNCGEHFTFSNPEMTSETCGNTEMPSDTRVFYANRRNHSRKLISIYNTSSKYRNKLKTVLLCYKINF